MRRTLFALAVFSAAALLISSASCEQRTHVLRVASINAGGVLDCDIADWQAEVSPEDPTDTSWTFAIPPRDTAEFEFQYVEVGAGLPTWTPYRATVTSYSITYRLVSDTTVTYDSAILPSTFSVAVDREGKKTSAWLTVVTQQWKINHFGGWIGDDPYEVVQPYALIECRARFNAFDSTSMHTLTSTGRFTISVGDFWDDPSGYGN